MLAFLLVIIYFAFISLGLPDSLLGTAWPSIYTQFGVPISWAGIISFTILGGTIISSFFSGRVIRKLGTGKTTAISVLMTAIALFGISLSSNIVMMFLFAIPLGLGAGSVDAALNNFVALHYKARHMSWLHCFWGVGATAGPIVMSYCLVRGGWKYGYASIGFIQVVLVIILFASLPVWRRFSQQIKTEHGEGKLVPYNKILGIKGMKPVLTAFMSYCAVEATAGLWGSSFLVISRGISPETAASWVSLFYLGITIGRFVSGFLMIRMNNKTIIRLGWGIMLIGLIMIIIPFDNIVLQCAFFILGIGGAPLYPALIHDTPANFGKENSQSIIGFQMACAYIGSTFMPPIFGFIGEYINMSLLPYFLLMFTLMMIFTIERLFEINSRGQNSPDSN